MLCCLGGGDGGTWKIQAWNGSVQAWIFQVFLSPLLEWHSITAKINIEIASICSSNEISLTKTHCSSCSIMHWCRFPTLPFPACGMYNAEQRLVELNEGPWNLCRLDHLEQGHFHRLPSPYHHNQVFSVSLLHLCLLLHHHSMGNLSVQGPSHC